MRDEAYAGQYLDMLSQTEEQADADRTERVLRYKSARYTYGQPLRLGGTLAGADESLLSDYDRIGLTAGEAFQLRDDVLGVFGDEAVTGKPAIDDIREGKRTMLFALAQESATLRERRVLDDCLGNPDLDVTGLARVRAVFESTGALERGRAAHRRTRRGRLRDQRRCRRGRRDPAGALRTGRTLRVATRMTAGAAPTVELRVWGVDRALPALRRMASGRRSLRAAPGLRFAETARHGHGGHVHAVRRGPAPLGGAHRLG